MRANVSVTDEALSHSVFSSGFGGVATSFGFAVIGVFAAVDCPAAGFGFGFVAAGVFAVVVVPAGFLTVAPDGFEVVLAADEPGFFVAVAPVFGFDVVAACVVVGLAVDGLGLGFAAVVVVDFFGVGFGFAVEVVFLAVLAAAPVLGFVVCVNAGSKASPNSEINAKNLIKIASPMSK